MLVPTVRLSGSEEMCCGDSSVRAGDADGGLVRKQGACFVEDIDGKQVLLVGATVNGNIIYDS